MIQCRKVVVVDICRRGRAAGRVLDVDAVDSSGKHMTGNSERIVIDVVRKCSGRLIGRGNGT